MGKSDIGLIGLAVMGQNLARNISRNHKISVYNRTSSVTEDFLNKYGSDTLVGETDLKDFVDSVTSPRKIAIMVKAGKPVDMVIESLIPLLDEGDTIIDFGNSNYHDVIRREKELSAKGFHFFGCGVSGGEEGALNGPSMMPGGNKEVWEDLRPILESVCAEDFDGGKCVTYLGENGAGLYVKMVHNGIEYGVMQMMAEAYEILSKGYGLKAGEIADIFEKYQNGKLESYLFEISIPILRKKDESGNDFLLDKILDKAGQKGTGRWTAMDALEQGVALSVITEAVFARTISSMKDKREVFSKLYDKPKPNFETPLEAFVVQLEDALYAGMLVSYAQGFLLLKAAAKNKSWDFDYAEIARIWQGGCIIRAKILKTLHTAFGKNPQADLLEIPEIAKDLSNSLPNFRKVVGEGMTNGIPLFCLSSALSSFEAMTSARGSANFIQGQRDFFGAHTFFRTDKDGIWHADWHKDGTITKIK